MVPNKQIEGQTDKGNDKGASTGLLIKKAKSLIV